MLPKEILKTIPLFRNLDNNDLELVSACLHRESYPKGMVIFKQGEYGDTMYIVESGQVAVVGEDGKETIAFMGPGSFVGEISLLLARPRTANLHVVLDAQLWALSKHDFDRLIVTRPSIALEMMRELSKRLVTTTQRKKFQVRPRRITAVFGVKGLELAHAVYAQLKSPVAVLPLPNAQAAADFPLNRGVMVMGNSDLNEASLAERLSYQIEVFKHVILLLPQQYDDLAEKAVELADTVVSIGRCPAWFSPVGKRGDFWTTGGSEAELHRIARRLIERTVGLALSSGGSRGIAHIGVLKVLIEENVPIDMVAGASAGALFGALYALGWSGEQLVGFMEELKGATRLLNWDFNFPPRTALVKGRIARDKLIARWVEHKDFEETLTPIYIVAADAYTGDEVIFDSGPLADAIRASLSIPILVEPWYYQERFLLDGGVVNPLPASVLRERGADIVIGSSVVQPMGQSYQGDTKKMPNILQVISNIFSTMEAEVIGKQLPLIDVLIQHQVSANHALDFDGATTLIEIGEQSARQMLPAIKEAIERVPEG
jgi:predicted acylesterase/phospholipase RssA/CRP-like cAMP-binding protein